VCELGPGYAGALFLPADFSDPFEFTGFETVVHACLKS